MSKWQKHDATGIFVGGEYYQADENGIVEIPDNVGSLVEYGFAAVRTERAPDPAGSNEHPVVNGNPVVDGNPESAVDYSSVFNSAQSETNADNAQEVASQTAGKKGNK